MNALGMVEVFGFTTAICCADIAAKSADVKIIALDKNKPAAGDAAEVPLIMNVKMEGSVSAVEAAVSAAKEYAVKKDLFVTSHIIPRPGMGTEKMAYISEVGKDRWVGDIRVKEESHGDLGAQKADTVQKTEPVQSEKPKNENTPKNTAVKSEEKSQQLTIEPQKKPRGRKPKNKN